MVCLSTPTLRYNKTNFSRKFLKLRERSTLNVITVWSLFKWKFYAHLLISFSCYLFVSVQCFCEIVFCYVVISFGFTSIKLFIVFFLGFWRILLFNIYKLFSMSTLKGFCSYVFVEFQCRILFRWFLVRKIDRFMRYILDYSFTYF